MSAYQEGRAARMAGATRDACPYPSGPFARSWVEGWTDSDTIYRALGA